MTVIPSLIVERSTDTGPDDPNGLSWQSHRPGSNATALEVIPARNNRPHLCRSLLHKWRRGRRTSTRIEQMF